MSSWDIEQGRESGGKIERGTWGRANTDPTFYNLTPPSLASHKISYTWVHGNHCWAITQRSAPGPRNTGHAVQQRSW